MNWIFPADSRVTFFYRDEKFTLPEPDSTLNGATR